MAFAKPTVGTGLTIAFGTTNAYSTLLKRDAALTGVSTPSVDTTHLGTTGGRTFIPGDLYDGGTLTFTVLADTDVPPVIVHATETITLTVPITDGTNGTAGTIAFDGFIQEYTTNFPLEDVITHDVTVKVAGTMTYTDSSV